MEMWFVLIRKTLGMCYLLLFFSCSGLEQSEQQRMKLVSAKAEEIYRHDEDRFFKIETPKQRKRDLYPFENLKSGNFPRITKEYFRCKGDSKRPPKTINQNTPNPMTCFDCGGIDQHSLPVKGEKEFIYQPLIDLLNFVQEKTGKKVIITCGHRCPKHNVYADPSKKNQSSKHLIGAEVDFYVQGMEHKPLQIVEILKEYYKQESEKDYNTFVRYQGGESRERNLPWCNKEVLIQVFEKDEGRDFDNNHKYPYISIQMRYDRVGKKRVLYSWHEAFNGFMRW